MLNGQDQERGADTSALAPFQSQALDAPPQPVLTIPSQRELETLREVASAVALSCLFEQAPDPETAKAQALAKCLYGRELGIPPMAAMTSIHVIPQKGGGVRLQLAAQMMLALALRVGASHVDHIGEDGVRVEWFRNGKKIGETRFTEDDARKAGLLAKDFSNHHKYSEDMRYWRAIARGVRRYFPDATAGMSVYVPGEIEDEETPESASTYENERAKPLRIEDFTVDEGALARKLIERDLVEAGALAPGAKANRAALAGFLAKWHPRTKQDLLDAATELFGEKPPVDAKSEPVQEEPAKPEPEPEPEPRAASKKAEPQRQSLFGPKPQATRADR